MQFLSGSSTYPVVRGLPLRKAGGPCFLNRFSQPATFPQCPAPGGEGRFRGFQGRPRIITDVPGRVIPLNSFNGGSFQFGKTPDITSFMSGRMAAENNIEESTEEGHEHVVQHDAQGEDELEGVLNP